MISASTLKLLRRVHLYIGVFIAPAILFFALTGALQTFSLHETTQGSSYKPPQWAVTLGQLHKKQTTTFPVRKPRPADASGTAKQADGPKAPAQVAATAASAPRPAETAAPGPKPKSHLPMKIFFLLVAIGLFTSTLTGLVMAYRYNSNKVVVTGLLVAGVVIPLLLLPF